MLNLRIYQINKDRDEKSMSFVRYESLERFQGTSQINSSIYDKVWEGEVNGSSLEDVYVTFNRYHPKNFKGHSLSVSDVVEIVSSPDIVGKIHYSKTDMSSEYTELAEYILAQERLREKGVDFEAHDYTGLNKPIIKSGFYFCDSFGFKEVEFEPEKTISAFEQDTNKIKVVVLNPGERAKIAEIDGSLEGMQKLVGGYIEPFYPYREEVCIVCNEEGKIDGLPLNRSVRDEVSGEVIDIIAGTAFICDCSGEKLGSLSEEQLKRYEKKHLLPEFFVRLNGHIVGRPYDPEMKASLDSRIQTAESKAQSGASSENSVSKEEPER